ncbi:tRNA (adenosine(37)-N6)-threonylcarbamoyltransferase complex transferase subunit TsaD [Zavarzinia compransoris]|uniref:tRNA (adenosine(37)-N6)-threonylcarbamoyltransferase complex transferase subunit TsaD n=1 Tax=Zavarzinia marina TaxID=2911065 RepID=UPI001F305545|nr:tRNA (adenosine(37)-N6)-threonylcarbamoyltransferase complex transferase subunit TsaD [Zavarzinia marina]MCF4165662.1 tRNA (adenosine(37)-N6)-threonylcarbamoyltransferase complex transferase subunit TsaD [Zavarzinia marina]
MEPSAASPAAIARPLVLGIESSCDETAAAVVAGDGRILSDVVLSQLDDHRIYGGVVPEIAARAHVTHLDGLIRRALEEAGLGLGDIDAVAATAGPGLIGGVIVGLTTAKAIALGAGKPLIGINHLEGHALTPRLVSGVAFPYLLLLVSGGHCQLLAVEGVGRYRRLGTTIDDAVGEAFDKTAKLLGLGYPGGPAVERAAASGDATRFSLPRPLIGRPGCDFSFSGLKTAVRETVAALPRPLSDRDRADVAAAFQTVVGAVIVDRTRRALDMLPAPCPLVVAGGVAANGHIRARLQELATARGIDFVAPPLKLCTDNAAMIAWAGVEHFKAGHTDALDLKPRARWPLDTEAAAPGAKA